MSKLELELRGVTAVVTGAASGIGLACAEAFAREGCKVALWDISANISKNAERISQESNVPATGIEADVSDATSVNEALAKTEDALGAVTILVHAAAVGSGKFGFPFTNLKPSDWPRVLEVNILGMVNMAHAIAPAMSARGAGAMTFVGSIAGQIGSQTDPPYSASKAANINFAQCLAKDLAPRNVRVNVVNPGMVQTPLNRRVWEAWNELQPPERKRSYEDWAADKIRAVTPLGRWQQPSDIADLIVFLSSARAAQITGQTINVDGGQVMHW